MAQPTRHLLLAVGFALAPALNTGCAGTSEVTGVTPTGVDAAPPTPSFSAVVLSDAGPTRSPAILWHANISELLAIPSAIQTILPQIDGIQVVVPWSFIDQGGGNYAWASLDSALSSLSAAGKEIAVSFSGVESEIGQSGLTSPDGGAIPDTPAYVLSDVPLVRCKVVTDAGRGESNVKPLPPTPVFWDPSYATPWRVFMNVALTHLAAASYGNSILYVRFGTGAADDAYPEADMDVGTDVTTWKSCNDSWAAAAAEVGDGGESFKDVWAGLAFNQVNYLSALSSPIALSTEFANIGNLDPTDAFPATFAAYAATQGFAVGNDAFGSQPFGSQLYDSEFGSVYGSLAGGAALFAQTSSPDTWSNGYSVLPCVLWNARGFGVESVELYEKALLVMFDPANATGENPAADAGLAEASLAALRGELMSEPAFCVASQK